MQQKLLLLIVSVLFLSFAAQAQFHLVEGTVRDEEGVTLPGVTVQLKGTETGATTDIDGKYRIRVPNKDGVLVFSFVGMKTLEVKAGIKPVIDVVLEMKKEAIDEVVCVGYGGVKAKEAIVGSVEHVDAEKLMAERPIESVDKMLDGMMAGVRVESNTGDPAAPVSVRIRGQSSLTQVAGNAVVASSEPLYILDGVPLYDVSAPNSTNEMAETKVNPLALINPDDIKSITVLKDASASAIYGANASNGVVIITTKKGERGKTKFTFTSNTGMAEPMNKFKYLNSEQYIMLATEAINNSELPAEDKQNTIAELGSPDVNTDWFDMMTRTGVTSKNSLTFSGGGDAHRYRFSVSTFNMKSIGRGNNMQRLTTRLNVNSDLTKKLKWNYILGVSHLKKNVFNSFESVTWAPTLSPYNEDGTFASEGLFASRMNPLAGLEQNENWVKNFYVNGSTNLSYQLTPELKVESTFGLDYNIGQNYLFNSEKNGLGRSRGGYIARLNKNNLKWISFTQASYHKTLFEDHQIEALAGFQIEDRDETLLKGSNSDLPFEKIKELGISEKENASVRSALSTSGAISWYGRLGYNFRNKYHLSVNLRRDQTSMFGGDSQMEKFASLGASWVISRESWFKSLTPALSFFKLRGSYGSTGNSRIGTYAAYGLYSYDDNYGYDGLLGAKPFAAPNPHLTWEKNYKFNLAIDMKLFKRVHITVEHYENRIKGAISNLDIPMVTGFSSVPVNVADMLNKGWELSISSSIVKTENFDWAANFNISANSNKVTKLGNDNPQFANLNYSSLGLFEGEEVDVILALRYAGVNPQTGQAQYYTADGTITSDTEEAKDYENRVFVGSKSPDAFGGFSTSFDYKSFSLAFVASFEWGGKLMLPWQSFQLNSDGREILVHNQSVNQLDRWQEPGDVTDIPKLSLNNAAIKNTTRNLFDRTNVHFKSISFSYRLPKNLVSRVGLNFASLNCNINNIGYWYKDDAAENRNGIAEYRFPYPTSRTYSLGVTLKF